MHHDVHGVINAFNNKEMFHLFLFRFVATGTELLNSIVTDSAQLFDFKTVYNLNEKQVFDM